MYHSDIDISSCRLELIYGKLQPIINKQERFDWAFKNIMQNQNK